MPELNLDELPELSEGSTAPKEAGANPLTREWLSIVSCSCRYSASSALPPVASWIKKVLKHGNVISQLVHGSHAG